VTKETNVDNESVVVNVTLKAVGVTEKGAAIGFECKLEDLGDDPTDGLTVAHRVLTESRLDVQLDVAEGAEQTALFAGAGPPQIKSVADCGRISAGSTTLTARLSFDRKTVDMDALLAFAGKQATLQVRRVGVAGGTRPADHEEGEIDPETGEPDPAPLREGAAVVHSGVA
jgi:hypothetical protein